MGECERELIEFMAYEQGYADAMRKTAERNERRRKHIAEVRKERRYFLVQKAAGLLMLAISIAALPAMDYDATGLLLTVPMGLALLLSRKHLLQIMGHDGDV